MVTPENGAQLELVVDGSYTPGDLVDLQMYAPKRQSSKPVPVGQRIAEMRVATQHQLALRDSDKRSATIG